MNAGPRPSRSDFVILVWDNGSIQPIKIDHAPRTDENLIRIPYRVHDQAFDVKPIRHGGGLFKCVDDGPPVVYVEIMA